jgi:hypothetical protein
MKPNLKTLHAIWPGALVVLSGLVGFVHASIRRIGDALWAQRLRTHFVIWPVALMAIGGLNRFAEALSKSIGDIIGTETLYPAKMWVTLLASVYLIWAMYAVWKAFKTPRDGAAGIRAV